MFESRRQSQLMKEAVGVTAPQMGLLKMLMKRGSMTHSELSESLYLTASTISGIVDRLEREGYVNRLRAEEDRRVVKVSLTDDGKALATKVSFAILGDMKKYLHELPDHELEVFEDTLQKVLTMMADAPDGIPGVKIHKDEQLRVKS
ncbi:MAG: MarR family transcriptional regulator [Planctomycetes bacterium]|nr:MarR family transcriptional regulator [Planctomycetota bacterium]